MKIIKKYANRRLYDTEQSRYVNLDDLAVMIRTGVDVQIQDAATGDDLSREVLLQVVTETMDGSKLLPAGFLRRVIRAGGDDPVQRMLRQQIGTALEVLSAQMDQVEALFAAVPFPTPQSAAQTSKAAAAPVEPPPEPAAKDAEMDELRDRLAKLEQRLKRS